MGQVTSAQTGQAVKFPNRLIPIMKSGSHVSIKQVLYQSR